MILANILFLSSLIENKNIYYKKPFLNNSGLSKLYLTSNKLELNKIGIVDFRKILRSSEAMKILGKEFITAKKKINKKLNLKKLELKKKEKKIIKQKDKISLKDYQDNIKLFKQEVFVVQNINKQERALLNKSFQKNQIKLKNLLAKIIQDISIKKNINIVLLKENIFLLNNSNIDLTNEALNSLNIKTKNITIDSIISN